MFKYFFKVIIRNVLKVFWIFPVNSQKICFQSFRGMQPTCNPLFIFQYLSKNHPEFKYIWLVNKIPENKLDNVLYLKKHSLRWFYEILTSKVIVTNNGFYSYLPLRKKAIIVETWHGGGAYKKVGASFDAKNKKSNKYKSLNYYAKHLCYYISSSKMFTQVMVDSTFVDESKFLPIGMPRNDIFFDKEKTDFVKSEIRRKFGFKNDDYLVLYAPTYRGEIKGASFDMKLDVQNLKRALREKTGRDIIVAFRGHHLVGAYTGNVAFDKDVSDYPVMQEILCATDMLITDYSSSMWDFSLLYRPCFLFVPDFDEYARSRSFYTPPEKWGFPICKSNKELSEKILAFNKDCYEEAVRENHKFFGSYESGTATKKISDLIVEKMREKK